MRSSQKLVFVIVDKIAGANRETSCEERRVEAGGVRKYYVGLEMCVDLIRIAEVPNLAWPCGDQLRTSLLSFVGHIRE